jgi:zinc protease
MNAIQKLSVSLRNCDFVANRKIDEVLFGFDNPYGRYVRKEDIESLTSEDMQVFFRERYGLKNARIFVSGKIDDTVIAAIGDCFGGTLEDVAMLPEKRFDVRGAEARKLHLSNDVNGVQGAIRIGRTFPNRSHPDFAPMVVLNTLFGGYFGSRLMSNIREDKGFTYGIYSSLTPERNGGSLIIHTETGREVVEDAICEIYHEMDVLRQEAADEEELLLVKNYLLGGLLADLDGPFSIMRRWRTLILNGFDETYFHNNVRIYKNITAKELQALAQKYLDPKDFYEVVVI